MGAMPIQIRALFGRLPILMLVLLLGGGASAAQEQELPAEGEPPRQVGEGVSRPEKISGRPPVYTEIARKAGVTGTVIVEAIIDENGDVTSARVLKGLPMGLDQASLDAVRTWKFKPARIEGRPVKVYYSLTVSFQIERSANYGPHFRSFLKRNPELAGHLSARRYADATALLDRWDTEQQPPAFEIELARVYILLEQRQLDAAWQKALAYRGPERYQILQGVGQLAWNRAHHDTLLSTSARAEVIEVGLLAATLAMEARDDASEAPALRSMLLLQKAKLTTDPAETKALLEEAKQLQSLAAELYQAVPRVPMNEQP
jgi:TonB family protein